MLNRISTTVVSPETAALDGFYPWLGAENDCEYHGMLDGYCAGFCVEVRTADGKLGYSGVDFVPSNEGTDILLPELENGSLADGYNGLGIMAFSCLHSGNTLTGRIVFRGYYTEHYDWRERETFYKDASAEVEELWKKWVV